MGSSPSRSSTGFQESQSNDDESGLIPANVALSSRQSQMRSSAQILPKVAISAKRIARAKKKEREAAKQKILDEYPELADSISAVQTFMKHLQDNVEEDVKTKVMSMSSKRYLEDILDFSFEHNAMEHRKLLGDEMATNKGGRTFTEYLRLLSTKTEETVAQTATGRAPYKVECQSILKSVCWNFSDASDNLCIELGRAGAFNVLVADIKDCADKLKDNHIRFNVVLPSLSILHNCAKVSDNKTIMKDAKVLEAIVPFLKADVQEIKMIAIMTVAYIIEEKDNDIISTDNSMIKYILKYLEMALARSDHKHDGFTAEEIVSGLMHIASNDKNKETIVNEGILPMVTKLLQEGEDSEKTIAAKTVWLLSFSPLNQQKILADAQLMKTLTRYSKAEGPWRESAAGAIWVLQEEERLNRKQESLNSLPSIKLSRKKKRITSSPPSVMTSAGLAEKSDITSSIIVTKDLSIISEEKTDPSRDEIAIQESYDEASPTDGEHIMISYQWECQKLMLRVKDKLESAGYRIWIDVESMGGSTLQAMAEAVEKSAVVLICMSRKYKESPNCRTEGEYAYRLRRPLIPIRVERNYQPDGWLGALQGAKLYYDFSNIIEFETVVSKLIKELGSRGKLPANETMDGPRIPVARAISLTSPPQTKRRIKTWTPTDVKEWASSNKIPIKHLSSVDGETLLFLKRLYDRAPEFFYKYAHDRLGVTELRGLLALDQALEDLTD